MNDHELIAEVRKVGSSAAYMRSYRAQRPNYRENEKRYGRVHNNAIRKAAKWVQENNPARWQECIEAAEQEEATRAK